MAIGWAIERAKRFFNYDQATIADRTAVYGPGGEMIEAPISKSFVSAMLSARSRVSPEVYKRLARATNVNVIDFHIAEGWEDEADIGAYHFVDQEVAHPILTRILKLPRHQRARAVGVVTATLDSIMDISGIVPSPLDNPPSDPPAADDPPDPPAAVATKNNGKQLVRAKKRA